MPSLFFKALLALTIAITVTGASAQKVFKCGNTYSQTPCPGAVIIDTADARSKVQKGQTDKATERDARAAQALEKARLQQEARDLANNTPVASTAKPPRNAASAATNPKKKKKPSEFFTAHAPGEKKKKQDAQKAAAQKDAGTP